MKKGFTLIELLGVIVVLGIIGLITIPIIAGVISDNNETIDEDQKKAIVLAAKNWSNANAFNLPEDGDSIYKTVEELISEGFLEEVPDEYLNSCVTISNDGGIYNYVYDKECSATSSEKYTITYNYTYNCTGYTCTTKAPASGTKLSSGSSADLSYTATKVGWVFIGWNTNPDATVGLSSYKVSSSNVTLYAIYRHNGYTYLLSTDGNGATSGSTTYSTCNTGFTYNNNTPSKTCKAVLPSNGFIKTGYVFNGWSTNSSATSGSSAGTTVTLSKNTTYYATWEETVGCTLTLDGTQGDNNWYTTNVKVSINVTGDYDAFGLDTSSGSTNGTTSITHSSDGSSITYYGYVKGTAGENYATCSKTFTRDATKPTCTVDLDGTIGNSSWYTTNVAVSLTRSDNLSGIAGYNLSTSSTASYSGTDSLTRSSDTSNITYYGYVKDNAGNTKSCNNSFKRDANGPSATISVSYASGVATLSATPTDSYSGVASYKWAASSSACSTSSSYITYSSGSVSTTKSSSGTYYLCMKDNAGNVSYKSATVTLVTPSCTINAYTSSSGSTAATCKTANSKCWFNGNNGCTATPYIVLTTTNASSYTWYYKTESGTTYDISNTYSPLGSNTNGRTYYATVTSSTGNTATCNLTVYRDTVAPKVFLQLWNGSIYEANGDDGSGNGLLATVGTKGNANLTPSDSYSISSDNVGYRVIAVDYLNNGVEAAASGVVYGSGLVSPIVMDYGGSSTSSITSDVEYDSSGHSGLIYSSYLNTKRINHFSRFSQAGSRTLKFTATDAVGNSRTQTISVNITS